MKELPKLNRFEYRMVLDILERMDAKLILDFEEYEVFKFTNLSFKDFLIEMPKVVDILASHKGEIRYGEFMRSLSGVVQILCEINDWRFFIDKLKDLMDTLQEARRRLDP